MGTPVFTTLLVYGRTYLLYNNSKWSVPKTGVWYFEVVFLAM